MLSFPFRQPWRSLALLVTVLLMLISTQAGSPMLPATG